VASVVFSMAALSVHSAAAPLRANTAAKIWRSASTRAHHAGSPAPGAGDPPLRARRAKCGRAVPGRRRRGRVAAVAEGHGPEASGGDMQSASDTPSSHLWDLSCPANQRGVEHGGTRRANPGTKAVAERKAKRRLGCPVSHPEHGDTPAGRTAAVPPAAGAGARRSRRSPGRTTESPQPGAPAARPAAADPGDAAAPLRPVLPASAPRRSPRAPRPSVGPTCSQGSPIVRPGQGEFMCSCYRVRGDASSFRSPWRTAFDVVLEQAPTAGVRVLA
jgi:hypothetical protein